MVFAETVRKIFALRDKACVINSILYHRWIQASTELPDKCQPNSHSQCQFTFEPKCARNCLLSFEIRHFTCSFITSIRTFTIFCSGMPSSFIRTYFHFYTVFCRQHTTFVRSRMSLLVYMHVFIERMKKKRARMKKHP